MHFHSYPLQDKHRLAKWLAAIKRDDFKPTTASRICGDHFITSDYHPGSRELKKSAVPSVFQFPEHLQKPELTPRRPPLKRNMTTPSSSVDLSVAKKSKVSPSKDELKKIIEKQKSEIKTLKQKIRRKEKKITCLSGVLSDLKEKSLINQSTASLLEKKFSGLTLEMIKNQLKNQDRGSQGRRYDEEVKKFGLTLNFYSPRAYEYIRGVFSHPHSNSLTEWTSSVECEPGIFMDVLKNLNSRIKENPTHADCVLICDAMSIKSSVFYNPTTGNYQFGNSLSTRHIEYKKNKMNVKIVCQTLSASSVADSIEFLMQSGNSDFKNAEGTIEFIRTIDKLFDLLNVRNPFGKGYKQPLRLSNRVVWEETIVASVRYLYNLKTSDGTPLLKHRRKTFVVGFITSLLSTKMLAIELMISNDFQYLLTYKFSQDHLELLFACIRGGNGFSNNPDIKMFKSALKRILLRSSIIASKHANCVTFEETSCRPIFSLKWAKNRTPLRNAETLDNVDDGNDTDVKLLEELPRFWSLCPYKNSITAYIGGYIIRSIRKTLSCLTCYHATVTNEKNASIDHNLIILKDRGGLFYPSEDVLRILKTSESVFKTVISSNDDMPEIKVKKHLGIRLSNLVLRSLPDVFLICHVISRMKL